MTEQMNLDERIKCFERLYGIARRHSMLLPRKANQFGVGTRGFGVFLRENWKAIEAGQETIEWVRSL